jgi:hypothetical protein
VVDDQRRTSMEIDLADGLLRGPDGEMRQIPELHVWSSCVYITRNGIARRRFYNSVARGWTWADEPLVITLDEAGRMGYYIGWWRSIELCIALAWLSRAENSTLGVRERVTVELVDDN